MSQPPPTNDEPTGQRHPRLIGRGDRPEAVVVPYDEYLRLQAAQKADILAQFDQLLARMRTHTAAISEDETIADVAVARAALARGGS